jgi:hypothetical protein
MERAALVQQLLGRTQRFGWRQRFLAGARNTPSLSG